METSLSQPVVGEPSVKLEARGSCSQQEPMSEVGHPISDSSKPFIKNEEKLVSCEAMDTNNNNANETNSDFRSDVKREADDSNARLDDGTFAKPSSATLRAKQAGSARMRNFMPGLITPEFRSQTETPISSSQLLNVPSSALFEGLDFTTPVGSGQFSPLASAARIGRKRQLSVSPLSSSSIDLNSLIRTSPTSLVNYITNSRSSSAGSFGHLSPSFFSKPGRLQTPLGRPPQFTLRNANYPQPSTDPTSQPANMETLQTESKEEMKEDSFASCQSSGLQDIKMEHDLPPLLPDPVPHQGTPLETVREESIGAFDESEDEGHPTDYPPADLELDADSEKGALDSKTKRVYYNYPSVEDPHNNQCRWADCTHQCDKLESLVQHVNNEHIYRDSRKEFVCYWNGCVREKKPFKAQYMLLVHMRRHTGEKPHKCTYEGCNKAYSRLENLKTHLRSHTGERPYVCKFEGCTKAFSNASDCAKHMNRTHTDEKPYACPNPGCTKRYTDPSSRRKHVKNCQVNKRARTGDPDAMSGGEDENTVDVKSSSSKKGTKMRKDKKKSSSSTTSSLPPSNPFLVHQPGNSGGGMSLSDHGYFSAESQGYTSSQLSYNSMPEGSEADYAKLHGEEDISYILQQQRLSDPHDAVVTMHQSNMGMPLASPVGRLPGDQRTDNPNMRASRQNGGGLTLPAGSIHPTPPPSHFQHIHSPSYPSSHSKYSQFQPFSNPSGSGGNQRVNRTTSSITSPQHYPNSRTTNGYRCMSPPRVGGNGLRKSPSDDCSSVVSGGLRSSTMTNSYSTFSSNSSRVSSPCSNSGGRNEVLRANQPISPRVDTGGFAHASLHAQVNDARTPGYQVKQNMQVQSFFSRESYTSKQSDTWFERSWRSSQSSRYSFTSELSDDLLENLPHSARRHTFTKMQPLPYPDSMHDDFTGMECGQGTAAGDQNGYMDFLPSQQIPNGDTPSFLSQIQSDNLGQPNSDPLSTLPLHHIDGGNAMDVTGTNGFSTLHPGLFSQEAPNEEYDLIFNDLPYTASTSNMMVGDQSSFAVTLSEENHYYEQMVSQVK